VFELEAVSAITTQKVKKTKQKNTMHKLTGVCMPKSKLFASFLAATGHAYTAGNALLSIDPAYRAFVAQAALRQRR
jgi:hypothetical protein